MACLYQWTDGEYYTEEQLRDLYNSTQVKSGVDFVFKQTPELGSIGTPEQYSQYLDTIFPNSKIKNIVYHGTNKKFDNFRDNSTFFTDTIEAATYGARMASKYSDNPTKENDRVIATVINLQNPVQLTNDQVNYKEGLNFNDNDGITTVKEDDFTWGGFNHSQLVVKGSSQIHILGSTKDIQGFRNFVNDNQEFNQIENTESSKASPETVEKVREFLKRLGIEIKSLDTTRYGGVNGVAQLLRGVVQVAEGKEGVALTEEAMHFVVEILRNTNAQLYGKLMGGINSYKIFKDTLDTYGQNPSYQINGKPNVVKIKEEAIGKLLAEFYIKSSEGFTEKPELMAKVSNWWTNILEAIRSLFVKAKFNPFEEVIKQVESGNIASADVIAKNLLSRIDISKVKGFLRPVIQDFMDRKEYGPIAEMIADQLADPNSYENALNTLLDGNLELANAFLNGDFLQIANKAVDEAYTRFIEEDAKTILNNQDSETDRHYTYNGERVEQTVTGKIKKPNKFTKDRTADEKIIDNQKKDWGSDGHKFAEDYFKSLIDKDGFKAAIPDRAPIGTRLPSAVQDKLKAYLNDLIASYPDGTRFAVEKKVVNTKVKGMLASTVDFLAFIPDAKLGMKLDILDWKFTTVNKSKTDDIPFFKSDEWKKQMGEYITIAKQYGVKPEQIRKARMVPFIANYQYAKKGDSASGLLLKSIEVGNIDSAKETKLYLLPVPVNDESTGNEAVDKLVKALRAQYRKVYDTFTGEQNKGEKFERLSQLSKAIRTLHTQKDFSRLETETITFGNAARRSLDRIEALDFSALDITQMNDILKELLDMDNSANVYTNIDEIYLSVYPRDTLDESQLKALKTFESISQRIDRLKSVIDGLQARAAGAIAVKQAVIKAESVEEAQEKILTPELEIKGLAKSFLEGTYLGSKIINLASNLFINRKSKQYQEEAALVNEFNGILAPFLKAAAGLKTPLDAIRDKNAKDLKLIKKIDPAFYKAESEASTKKDKQFFLDNMDLAKYKEMTEERIKTSTENILQSTYVQNDDQANDERQQEEIKKLKNSLDIESKDFNGWGSYNFTYYFRKSAKNDNWINAEFKEMAKTPEFLAVWEFYTKLNERGRKSGYIDKQGLSFLPMIQGTIIEKLAQAQDKPKEIARILREGYVLDVNEKYSHAQIDEETGKVIRNVPKFFTRTDKELTELSQDITKITAPWIKALLNYETSTELENVMLTLYEVEQSKGHLQIDPSNQKVIFENSTPKSFPGNEGNTRLLEKIINDDIYGISEDSNTKFDLVIDKFTKGSEEDKKTRKVQGKKALQGANRWTQSLATGAKLMVSIPNFVGNKMQAIINAGTFYRGREYEYNNDIIVGSVGRSLSAIDKGLIDLIHPLNEDVTLENSRKLALTQSTAKYLSTWTISDVLQSTNRLGDRAHELTNAKTFNDNAMVEGDRIVNIRQFLMNQDAKTKYKMSFSDRKALEDTFEQRVKELKDTRSLSKTAKFNDKGFIEIPGVTPENLGKYRTTVVEYARKISGAMSRDNKADYTRDTMFKSFMMFKNWIPKQVALRTLGIKRNNELETWEYGRTRLFAKVWSHLGIRRIFEMRDIIAGNENGLKIMQEIIDEKRLAHFQATGQELEITDEEFFDMVRKELHSQSKELVLLVGILSVFLASKAAQPDKDDDELTQNRYKWWRKLANKVSNELDFYYNPASADSITRGSIVPSLSILNKTMKFFKALEEETRGHVIGDQDLIDNTYPLKYFLNLIPGPAQFDNEILPYIDPEMAKNMGIRVTDQARQGQ